MDLAMHTASDLKQQKISESILFFHFKTTPKKLNSFSGAILILTPYEQGINLGAANHALLF